MTTKRQDSTVCSVSRETLATVSFLIFPSRLSLKLPPDTKGDEKLDGHEYIGDNLTRARNEIFSVDEPKAHDEIHKNP